MTSKSDKHQRGEQRRHVRVFMDYLLPSTQATTRRKTLHTHEFHSPSKNISANEHLERFLLVLWIGSQERGREIERDTAAESK